MYTITYTEDALEDLEYFRKSERQLILDEIDQQLSFEPAIETKNRKRLRPNQLGEWELRIRKYRVFYDVFMPDEIEIAGDVKIIAVGARDHNRLFIRGEEFEL